MNILSIGAHPDDIEVHCGGTAAKYAKLGHTVIGVIVSQASIVRRAETEKAFGELGIGPPIFLGTSSAECSDERKLVGNIDELMDKYRPDMVLTHHPGDYHQDHRAVAFATISACRRSKASILLYDRALPGRAMRESFIAQWYEPLTVLDLLRKMTAVKCHESQNGKQWIRAIMKTAKFRGCGACTKFAEAFQIVKIVSGIQDVD